MENRNGEKTGAHRETDCYHGNQSCKPAENILFQSSWFSKYIEWKQDNVQLYRGGEL